MQSSESVQGCSTSKCIHSLVFAQYNPQPKALNVFEKHQGEPSVRFTGTPVLGTEIKQMCGYHGLLGVNDAFLPLHPTGLQSKIQVSQSASPWEPHGGSRVMPRGNRQHWGHCIPWDTHPGTHCLQGKNIEHKTRAGGIKEP